MEGKILPILHSSGAFVTLHPAWNECQDSEQTAGVNDHYFVDIIRPCDSLPF